MKKAMFFSIIWIVTLSLLLAACNLPGRSLPDLMVRMTSPLDGQVVGLRELALSGAALNSAESAATGVTRFIFFANGLNVGQVVPDPERSEYPGTTASLNWTPPAPGEYRLQLEAQRSDGSALSNPLRICVLPTSFAGLIDPGNLGYGYTGLCDGSTPTPRSARPPTVPVSMIARAIPAGGLAYDDNLRPNPDDVNNPLRMDSTCPRGYTPSSLAFEVTVADPDNLANFVNVEILADIPEGRPGPAIGPIILNQTASTPDYEAIYTGGVRVIDADLSYAFLGSVGSLMWTARAYNLNGEIVAQDGPHTLLAGPCTAPESAHQGIVIAPTDTPTPDVLLVLPSETPTSTATPTPGATILLLSKNANCRYGPGSVYPVLTSFLQGQSLQVDGRSATTPLWWQVALPNSSQHCWVSDSAGTPDSDPNALPVIPAPPTPTVTPKPGKGGIDFDKDGYPSDVDCDDKNAKIHPGAAETAKDGVDSNCDGKDDS